MRLLQLNIWEGYIVRHVPAYIKSVNPDLVCLQEVYSGESKIAKPSRMLNSLQEIQTACEFPEVFFSPTFSSLFDSVKIDYGNVILSRYPLKDKQTIFISGAYNPKHAAGISDDDIRNLQIARVQLPGKQLTIANFHGILSPQPDGLGDEMTVKRMRLVKKHLQKVPTPLIFAGDLNVNTNTPTMKVFDGFLNDLTQTHNISTTLNSFGKVDNVACDHVLISPEVTVKDFRVEDVMLSDHKPLIFDFEI